MKDVSTQAGSVYRPLPFVCGTFLITWCCAALAAVIDGSNHPVIFTLLDFWENASPFLCAFLLLRRQQQGFRFLYRFLLGSAGRIQPYLIVLALFAAQFLNFYCFRSGSAALSVRTFLLTWAGQLLLGGGLEEAGWRGYLLPCFCEKCGVLTASAAVSGIWVLWHLPYFFLPGNPQTGESLLFYALIGLITGFLLTAIYLLTQSVLLCILFHSWQNAIVLTIPAETTDFRFLLFFLSLGAAAIWLCRESQRPRESRQKQ